MRHRSLSAVPLAALLALAAAVPAAQAAAPRCARGFRCATLAVPLDRTGAVAGSVRLRYAVRSRPRRGPLLIALSGGPGQPSVAGAQSFAASLSPMLRRHRLAVLDQRGTGASGALRCPSVQRLRSLDPFTPGAVAACARRLGPRRAFYTTADTVLDLDALRRRLGAPRVTLMGISYGTHVALQYARTFPQRTERLILDSIVGPDGPDPFLLDTYRHLPRVLREQCAGGACRGVTADPVGDARAFAERLARGPVRGQARDRRGRLRPVAYRSQEEALYLLLAGDLNPFLQAALPAALASARAGDDALLLALHRAAAGPRTPLADLSFGLNVTTGCTDGGTPWPLSAPPQQRRAEEQQSLAAVAPGDYAPFQAATVLASGYGDDCLLWPRDVVRAPSAAPLPDVPALLLGGGLDLRTPAENAVATAALLPRAQVVRLAGSGHDVLDSDVTGCAARALARFAAGQAVGRPCAGKDDAVRPLPLPPPSLDVFRAAAGVPGRRGRVLSATVETAQDAQIGMLQDLLAGVAIGRGGLRGGSYAGAGGDGIVLRDYEYLRGLRVSGRLAGGAGALRVRGLASGRVRIGRDGAVRGTLDGHRVRSRPARGAAAARRVPGLRVDGPSLDPGPWLGDRLRALLRRREVARARP